MSPTYRQRKRLQLHARAMDGVAARERNRMERNADCGQWKRVATMILLVSAAPDGRRVAIKASHGRGEWYRCGSERAVRGALADIIWSMKGTTTP